MGYYRCKKCGEKLENPLVDCVLLEDSGCGKKEKNKFEGWI